MLQLLRCYYRTRYNVQIFLTNVNWHQL